MKVEFLFIGGARSGERIDLADKQLVRIGRHPDNDVAFDSHRDLNVSGHHAEVRKEDDGYYLHDIGSSNGTFVQGEKVDRLRLASGMEVVFGTDGPTLRVRFVDDTDTVPAPEAEAPSPGEQVAAALGPGRQVGARTVAMMIDSAMLQAKGKRSSLGKSTVFVRSMVNQAVTRSTRRFRVISLILMVLLLGTVAGFLVLRHFEHRRADEAQEQLRSQMARLMERQQGANSSQKQQLARELDRLNKKLAKASPVAAGGKAIVHRNIKAVFLMAYDSPTKGARGFCTAFAVRKRILATNAHCIVALSKFRARGYKSFVVMNRAPGKRFRIARVAHHPRYHKPRKTISQDVGLVQVGGDLPVMVTIASDAELRDLESGGTMYMYGFPGRLANVRSPNATLVQGVIGRVTKLDGSLGSFRENLLIQHSAFTSGGTSGSPIFNESGKVIAVNTGGYVEPGSLQVLDPTTGRAGRLMVAKQLAGYNFGVRVDALLGLLADLGR